MRLFLAPAPSGLLKLANIPFDLIHSKPAYRRIWRMAVSTVKLLFSPNNSRHSGDTVRRYVKKQKEGFLNKRRSVNHRHEIAFLQSKYKI